uniref:EOG090X05H5 n=1 Tax=Daphnia longispina TaxID=42846 RepID=A0A4Y7M536_9CRUS|nr:EOG090X05H5 [Daphnia longispina]
MMMIKKENKMKNGLNLLSTTTVISPPSLSDRTNGSTEQDQQQQPTVTPSKNRKQSLLQQQQQVANGFPVTVFPPAADNNCSPQNPPSSIAGPFQQQRLNNNNSKNNSRANNKPEQKPAVINRPVKEAPPPPSSLLSSSSNSRRDNNNGDEAAAAAVMVATYGDAAKTKTISRRKSERIARILRGEDRSNGADSSKFRFWVRAKGFRLGGTAGNPTTDSSSSSSSSPSSSISSADLMSAEPQTLPFPGTNDPSHDELYVVTSTAKDELGGEDRPVYKKVAVVEDFFDIIYREHVEFMSNSGGRPPTGKHAGQKRTYRAFAPYGFGSDDKQHRPESAVDQHAPQTRNIGRCFPSATPWTGSRPQGMTAGYQMDHQEIKQNSPSSSSSSSSTSSTPNRMMTSIANATDPITLDLSSKTLDVTMCDAGDHSPGTVKDEDDEDDDDGDDRIDTQDPERLKAFNMFVRLFVDENLDRMVPISRQPREKIQAIIDSCLRQFPEFGERARKRIRTYLKSCRRHKRTREDPSTPGSTGLLSPNRPMPSHLTSVVAEQILAQACENENQNAKRLRLGLDPISQPLPPPTAEGMANSPTAFNSQPTEAVHSSNQSNTATIPTSTTTNASPGQITNLFRPAFGPYQRSSSNTFPQLPVQVNQGPTDLSTKSRPTPAIFAPPTSNGLSSRSSPLQPHKLNAAEILAVRQLVTGYRESAAFLLRSADELEQLLHQQHSTL